VFLTRARHTDAAAWQRFTEEALKRLESLPGVESAGATSFLPLTGFQDIADFTIVGQPPPPTGQEPTVDYRYATPGYFHSVGMRVVRGRAFTADDRSGSPCVAVVNETLARRYFLSQDPVGQQLNMGSPSKPYLCEVVGLVNDVHSFGLEQEVHSELFIPLSQAPSPFAAFTLRTSTPPMALADAVRRAIWDVDRDQPIYRVMPFERLAADTLTLRRVSVLLMGFFSGLAILLAGIGVYGVVSCMVGQRTVEIGIRLALGARPGVVARMIMSEGMQPVLAGLALGLAGAFGVTRLMSGLVYGTAGSDPVTFAAALLVLLGAGAAASYFPARRATRIDPIAILKQE
jgi:putative ABC transport system permease protein